MTWQTIIYILQHTHAWIEFVPVRNEFNNNTTISDVVLISLESHSYSRETRHKYIFIHRQWKLSTTTTECWMKFYEMITYQRSSLSKSSEKRISSLAPTIDITNAMLPRCWNLFFVGSRPFLAPVYSAVVLVHRHWLLSLHCVCFVTDVSDSTPVTQPQQTNRKHKTRATTKCLPSNFNADHQCKQYLPPICWRQSVRINNWSHSNICIECSTCDTMSM